MSSQDSLATDSIIKVNEENYKKLDAPVDTASLVVSKDSVAVQPEKKIWIPNSSRAVWLAAVFPGAGQVYNRKYWKLPIIYGGFLGCAYALTWNNKMYWLVLNTLPTLILTALMYYFMNHIFYYFKYSCI